MDAETAIVNRELAEWIVPSSDEASHFPEVEIGTSGKRGAKDFTGIAPI